LWQPNGCLFVAVVVAVVVVVALAVAVAVVTTGLRCRFVAATGCQCRGHHFSTLLFMPGVAQGVVFSYFWAV
jgi:hypothetical protein